LGDCERCTKEEKVWGSGKSKADVRNVKFYELGEKRKKGRGEVKA